MLDLNKNNDQLFATHFFTISSPRMDKNHRRLQQLHVKYHDLGFVKHFQEDILFTFEKKQNYNYDFATASIHLPKLLPIVNLVQLYTMERPIILSKKNLEKLPNSSRNCIASESVFIQENTIMITGDKTTNVQVGKPLKRFDNGLIETQLEKPSKWTCLGNLPEKPFDKPLEHISNDVLKSNSIINGLTNCDNYQQINSKNKSNVSEITPFEKPKLEKLEDKLNETQFQKPSNSTYLENLLENPKEKPWENVSNEVLKSKNIVNGFHDEKLDCDNWQQINSKEKSEMSDVVSFKKQQEKLEERSTETQFEKTSSKSNCDNSFQQKINSKEKPELLEEAQFEKPCKQSNCLEKYTEEPYDTTWKKSTESKIEEPLNSTYSENSIENQFEKPHDKENSIDSSNEDSEWEYYSDDDSPMLSSDKLKPFRVSKVAIHYKSYPLEILDSVKILLS